jgi:hypothetical protein
LDKKGEIEEEGFGVSLFMQERIQKGIGGIPLFLLHLISNTFNLNKLTPILPFIYIFLIFFI